MMHDAQHCQDHLSARYADELMSKYLHLLQLTPSVYHRPALEITWECLRPESDFRKEMQVFADGHYVGGDGSQLSRQQ